MHETALPSLFAPSPIRTIPSASESHRTLPCGSRAYQVVPLLLSLRAQRICLAHRRSGIGSIRPSPCPEGRLCGCWIHYGRALPCASSRGRSVGASQNRDGNSLAGNQCQRWLGVACRLWARRSAGARSGRTVESVTWGGCEGRHKAGSCWDLEGPAGRGLTGQGRLGTRSNIDTRSATDVVGGGVAGAPPPHKGGPTRPDRPKARRE